jgi:O-antigen/teichoic acid export membrane protein
MSIKSSVQSLIAGTRSTAPIQKLEAFLRTSLYRNALYLMIDEALNGLSGFAFWIAAAHYYDDGDVSIATAASNALFLLVFIATLGLDFALVRFLPNAGDKSHKMINTSLTVGGVMSLLTAGVFLAGLGFWSDKLLDVRDEPLFLLSFVVFTVACTLSTLVMRTYVASRRSAFALAKDVIHAVLKIVLVFFFVSFASLGIFASWGVGLLVSLGIGLLFFLPRIQRGYRPAPAFDRPVLSQMVRFAGGNYIIALLWVVTPFVLPVMVLQMREEEGAAAWFSMAWAAASLLFAIASATSTSLFAEGSHDKQKLGVDTTKSLKLVFALLVPAILLILLIGDKILLLFGREYSEQGTNLLRILAVSALPLSINYIYFGVKRVQIKLRVIAALSAVVSIGTLGLSYILLPRMGIEGVGVAWIASQTLAAVFSAIGLFRTRLKLKKQASPA